MTHRLKINPMDTVKQYNFADALYQIFKAKHHTSLKYADLSAVFTKLYGKPLKTKEVSALPFIKFGTNLNDHNMVFLTVESDDICDGCKVKGCPLLHTFSPDDEFITTNANGKIQRSVISIPSICLLDRLHAIFDRIKTYPKAMSISKLIRIHNKKYPQFMSHQPTLNSIMHRFKAEFSTEYNAKLQDQMIIAEKITLDVNKEEKQSDELNIVNDSEWFLKRDSADRRQLENLKNLTKHISPLRSPRGKGKRAPLPTDFEKDNDIKISDIFFDEDFDINISRTPMNKINSQWQEKNSSKSASLWPVNNVKTDEDANIVCDVPLLVVPEQLNKYYLLTELSEDWKDKELISHFLSHIQRNSGVITSDVYLGNRRRVGFFTAAHPSMAEDFVRKVRYSEIRCWGRTVEAELVKLRRQKKRSRLSSPTRLKGEGCRVKVKNVNCVMRERDFKEWVCWLTKTFAGSVSGVELLYPRKQKGGTQCICVFDHKSEQDDVLYALKDVPFRGSMLKWSRWSHGEHEELVRLKIDAMKERQREADELAEEKAAKQKLKLQALEKEDYTAIPYMNKATNSGWVTTEVQDISIRRNSKNQYTPNNTSLSWAMYNKNSKF